MKTFAMRHLDYNLLRRRNTCQVAFFVVQVGSLFRVG